MTSSKKTRVAVGDVLEVEIEKIAHGGHFIARHNGAVIFIRHAIPGERCRIEITSIGSSFNRAEVIEVLEKSPDRVLPPCSYSHRSGCGGCDFQHISISRQRQLKAEVITEQFARIAKMNVIVEVEEIDQPLRWRTRAIATTDRNGKLGFYGSRSHSVIPISDCLTIVEEMALKELTTKIWKSDVRVEIAISNTGERNISLAPTRGSEKARLTEGPQILHQVVGDRTLEVSNESFWQSHKRAPELLTRVVLDFAEVKEGDHVLDLYGGVGLFTSALISHVGLSGSIELFEGSKSATSDAFRNFSDNINVKVITGDVTKLIPRVTVADVVILDPPREGAGKNVLIEIARIKPRAVVYVACDPAALARDSAYFLELGYSLVKIRAFDLFPMTHHIECVALYLPVKVS